MPDSALLELRDLSKSFGGVAALSTVSLAVERGEVLGLVGQNGAGKSTLIKILTGYHSPDSGQLFKNGKEIAFPIRDPKRIGIAVIHQDLGLVGSMSALENFGISDGYRSRQIGRINWTSIRRIAAEALNRLECDLDLDALVEDLNPADRAILAIARATQFLQGDGGDHVFILDEPTAYLGPAEAARVMAVMRRVAESDSSVIFVSHKINEVMAVTDRCTVLRDGITVATVSTPRTSAEELVRLQLGESLDDFYPDRAAAPRDTLALQVSGLSGPNFGPVDFEVAQGEILGLTGLAGMGQDELVQVIAGVRDRQAGDKQGRDGQHVPDGIRAALNHRIALVPADRKGEGLWLDATARENLSLPQLAYGKSLKALHQRSERTAGLAAMKRVGVRPLTPDRLLGMLSGGNQQKVLFAKWLEMEPEILLLHEPTQGVDAHARREILGLVVQAAELGAAIVICSTDYEQIANVCHRALVMEHGKLIGELQQPFDDAQLLLACHGAMEPTAGTKPEDLEANLTGESQ